MDFEQKYLDYKKKYYNLFNTINGGSPETPFNFGSLDVEIARSDSEAADEITKSIITQDNKLRKQLDKTTASLEALAKLKDPALQRSKVAKEAKQKAEDEEKAARIAKEEAAVKKAAAKKARKAEKAAEEAEKIRITLIVLDHIIHELRK